MTEPVYVIQAACGNCGGGLRRITQGDSEMRPGREAAGVVRCENCNHYWVIRVEMLRAPADAAAAERARDSRKTRMTAVAS